MISFAEYLLESQIPLATDLMRIFDKNMIFNNQTKDIQSKVVIDSTKLEKDGAYFFSTEYDDNVDEKES